MLNEEGLDERVRPASPAGRGGARGRARVGARNRLPVRRRASTVVTTVMMPDGPRCGRGSDGSPRERFNLSLGAGLGKLKGRAFRIGHLGDFNDLMLVGTLCGVEMGLTLAGVPFRRGGVDAAIEALRCRRRQTPESSVPGTLGGRFARNAATPSLKSSLRVAHRDQVVDRVGVSRRAAWIRRTASLVARMVSGALRGDRRRQLADRVVDARPASASA